MEGICCNSKKKKGWKDTHKFILATACGEEGEREVEGEGYTLQLHLQCFISFNKITI